MVEAFNQAVSALLQQTDPARRQDANKWLEQWQQTPDAWAVASEVLHGHTSIDAQYFAAQTLRTKVQRDFEELPPEAVMQLRESLVALTLQHARSSPAVRTQLCLSIAALALHLPAEQWVDANDANAGHAGVVMWLWSRFGGQSPDVALPCMLELLTVLPEEASSFQPAVRPARRRAMVNELSRSKATAFQILTAALQQPGVHVQLNVCRAFASWLRLTSEPFPADCAQLLVHMVLHGLRVKDTFDAAVDAIVEIIYCSAVWQDRRQLTPEWHAIVQAVLQSVMELRPRFVSVAQATRDANEGRELEGNEFDDDEETAKGMARLFAEAGEAYAPAVIEGQSGWGLVQAMLEVAAFPDDNICAISFNFWHRVSRLLTSDFSPALPEGHETSSPPTANGISRQVPEPFLQAYEQLVDVIRGRVRYPDDFDSWHQDDKDEFRRSRYAIGDTLVDASAVLKGERMMALLAAPLQHELAAISSDSGFDWRNAEAALFCIKAVHRTAPDAGDAGMLALMASWMQLPPQPALQYTLCGTVAVYADWLAASLRLSAGQQLPALLLHLLGRALGHETSAAAAAQAIRYLCDACARHLVQHWSLVVELYNGVQAAGAAAPQANGTAHPATPLSEEDVQQVMEGVALVVNALQQEQRPAGLHALFTPVVQPMHQLLAAQPVPGNIEQRETILTSVDRMSVLFRHVKQPAAVVEVFAGVWPLLQAAFGLYGTEPRPAERLCKAIRYALRGAGQAMAPHLPPLLTLLPAHFASSRHSCYLYAASECIKTFGGDSTYEAALSGMLSRMLGDACSALPNIQAFNDNPDLADDTFLLVGRTLSYAPRLILAPGPLTALLDTAIAGVLVQHREACGSIMTFLTQLMEPENRPSDDETAAILQATIMPRAPVLVRLLLAGAAGALPPNRCMNIADVLYALLKSTGQQGLQIASEAVQCLPDAAVSAVDRDKLLAVMHRTASDGSSANNYGDLEDALEDISDSCRRNWRARETAQQALLPQAQAA